MCCSTKVTVVEAAIRAVIKEVLATYEARRGKQRQAKACQPCPGVDQEVRP